MSSPDDASDENTDLLDVNVTTNAVDLSVQ